ncbi:MAG TPA: helix-turn-helix domain-containing protein, partial [Thermoplasmatales archaeon]|nr:helix-turn-helix domain-containing protein [Thermoplasmatales archaeon]
MRKLNQRKIRWIIREMEKGERSVYRIAKLQNVTSRWVRELYRRYTETGEYPYPDKPGRKPSPISDEERRIVLEIRKQHPVCAVTLEKILDKEGIHISHNRIHGILKEEG